MVIYQFWFTWAGRDDIYEACQPYTELNYILQQYFKVSLRRDLKR